MKVFISSTFIDFKKHREILIDTMHRLASEVEVVSMEYFGSSFESPSTFSLMKIKEAQIYIGIFGFRYGSLDRQQKMSITEMEYRTALAMNIPVYLYLLPESKKKNHARIDKRIIKLREEIKQRHVIQYFKSPEDLARRVVIDMHKALRVDKKSQESRKIKLDEAVGPTINVHHPYMLAHLVKKTKTEDIFNVRVYIDIYEKNDHEYAEKLKEIDKVVYQMHESFRTPVFAMQNWRRNFKVEFSVWGEFWIQATIYFKNQRKDPIKMQRFINIMYPEW